MKKIITVIASIISKPAAVLLFLLVAVSAMAVFSQIRYQSTREELETLRSDPQAKVRAETEELIAKISILTDLPQDEVPMIATVSDASVLQDQSFFRNAQNGDKILVYTQASRAVLYRPSTNKVIEVGPVDINKSKLGAATSGVAGESDVPTTTEPAVATVRVVVYNGTSTDNIDDMVDTLSSVENVEIVDSGKASGAYDRTMIIKLKDNVNGDVVANILDALQAEEADLPSEEKTPGAEADLLVILGSSKP